MLLRRQLSKVLVIGGATAALVFVAGCSSTSERAGSADSVPGELAGAPAWAVKGCASYWSDDKDSQICGVGSAAGSRNVSLMRTAAIGRGRTEIARSLETMVEAMLKDYASTTTGGEEFGTAANDEQFIVDVSKQITDMSLSGTEMIDSWISNSGTFWALVALDVSKFSESVSRMDQLSERVREAVVSRAEKSFAELDEEIEAERNR